MFHRSAHIRHQTSRLSWSVNTHTQSKRSKWQINSTQSSVYVIRNMPTVNITCSWRSSNNMQHDVMAVHYLHWAKSTWDSNKLSVNQELLTLWKPNVHYLGHISSMQASMLRFIILTSSAGVSKVVSVFQVSPTKTFYAFYVSLIVVDFKGCSWEEGGTVRQPRTEESKGQENGRQK